MATRPFPSRAVMRTPHGRREAAELCWGLAESFAAVAGISTASTWNAAGSPRDVQFVGTPTFHAWRWTTPVVRKYQTIVCTPPLGCTDCTISVCGVCVYSANEAGYGFGPNASCTSRRSFEITTMTC